MNAKSNMQIGKKLTDDSYNRFWFDNGVTAHGVENRRYKLSRDPHSSLAAMSISEPAKLLRSAVIDQCVDSADSLHNYLSGQVQEYAAAQSWGLKGRHGAVAEILLSPYIHNHLMSERECAKRMCINHSSFRESWRGKIGELDRWVKAWFCEIDNISA